MTRIHFKAILFKIGQWTILQLPEDASAKLPSRGQTMIKGTMNGYEFQTVLEPDGNWSHFFKVEKALRDAIGIDAGDTVELNVETSKDWPEPNIPKDIKSALSSHPDVQKIWAAITPLARWDWIRWISGTKSSETRKHRIEVSLSKLKQGDKRPCCFNRAMCTDPYVSEKGKLLQPSRK